MNKGDNITVVMFCLVPVVNEWIVLFIYVDRMHYKICLIVYSYYFCGMEINLDNMSLENLTMLRNSIDNIIHSRKDGYFYICRVRSFGRVWDIDYIHNTYTLQELCDEYSGDNGIVDVYSNNPDLDVVNYAGDNMFIPTIEDYNKWKEYTTLSNYIMYYERNLNDSNTYGPFVTLDVEETKKEIDELKKRLDSMDKDFITPVSYN